jgi:hypothetical protein
VKKQIKGGGICGPSMNFMAILKNLSALKISVNSKLRWSEKIQLDPVKTGQSSAFRALLARYEAY